MYQIQELDQALVALISSNLAAYDVTQKCGTLSTLYNNPSHNVTGSCTTFHIHRPNDVLFTIRIGVIVGAQVPTVYISHIASGKVICMRGPKKGQKVHNVFSKTAYADIISGVNPRGLLELVAQSLNMLMCSLCQYEQYM